MAQITYTKTASCSGGGHFTLTRTGAFGGTLDGHISAYLNNPPTAEELRAAENVFLRLHCNGKTVGQINQDFTAGVKLESTKLP